MPDVMLPLVKKAALATALLGASLVQAASLDVTVEIPRLKVAEYHNPYVALWLEDEAGKVTQLAVWYDVGMRENKGQEWLKDMRQWWRRGGRTLQLPIDGLSGATRGPGAHRIPFAVEGTALAQLAPGQYRLRVEAAREVGGRELVEVPLTWPLGAGQALEASGSEELGRITVQYTP